MISPFTGIAVCCTAQHRIQIQDNKGDSVQNHTATHWSIKIAVALAGALLFVHEPQVARAAEPLHVLSGTVAETTNSGGYTYLLVDDGQTKQWVATTAVEAK